MGNLTEERNILKAAAPCLTQLYGIYQVDETQVDRPDAAIFSMSSSVPEQRIRIGIEITTVDNPQALRYFNETRLEDAHNRERISNFMEGAELRTQVAKRATIEFPRTYITDGLRGKVEKHNIYRAAGEFHQLVLIAFTEYLPTTPVIFDFHVRWTNFLLSQMKYPFDYVILVLKNTNKCKLIYDKQRPSTIEPKGHIEATVQILKSGFMPIGKGSLGTTSDSPAIPMRKKKKTKGLP